MECARCSKEYETSDHNFFCSDECADSFWDDYDGMTPERREEIWDYVLKTTMRSAMEHLQKAFNVAKKNPPSPCGLEEMIARVREGIFAGRG